MKTAFAIGALLAIVPAGMAESIAGRWQGTFTTNKLDIPFRIDFQGDGSNVKGTLFNGDEKYTSTSGRLENGALLLNWDYYASKLEGTLKDGVIDGQYTHRRDSGHVHATRFAPAPPSKVEVPSIAGLWELEGIASGKGESAWRFIVRHSGPEVSATILRVDGDTGTLSGSYRGDGKFVLSHFSGVRPSLLEVTPAGNTLQLVLNGKAMTALRPAEARAKGLAEPDDPLRHTGVKDQSEPFHFSFPDLSGKVVSNGDARFRGKVVLIEITGSWCPNCHDETPFLVELYKKYHSQGLEIVALDFEEAEQLKDPVRLRAFIKNYGIDYTVLLGGETGEAKDKLTQAVHWDAWPTTFFLGRDGKVDKVHAGFPSSASGELFTEAKEEFTASVGRLLAAR